MTQTHAHAHTEDGSRRLMMGPDPLPVHARDAERWSEPQWKRWCIEQAVAARGGRSDDVQIMAERLLRFACPSTALVAPIE